MWICVCIFNASSYCVLCMCVLYKQWHSDQHNGEFYLVMMVWMDHVIIQYVSVIWLIYWVSAECLTVTLAFPGYFGD